VERVMGIEPTRLALSRQPHQLLETDVGSACDWRVNGFTWESRTARRLVKSRQSFTTS